MTGRRLAEATTTAERDRSNVSELTPDVGGRADVAV